MAALVNIPADTWVDLYAASGITVGTQLSAQVQGSGVEVKIQTSATQPTELSGVVLKSSLGMQAVNKAGSVGEWAYSVGTEAALYVSES